MKLLVAVFCLLCLAWGSAMAQFQVGKPATKPTAVAPDYAMPAGKIYIDLATLPKGRVGYSTARTALTACTATPPGAAYDACIAANTAPDPQATVEAGAFRVACKFSHVSFDDPIVWPGQPGKTHGHQFFGNRNTASGTDLDNMATAGNSSCAGGILNRTGYWTPYMVYHRPGNIRDGEALPSYEGNFYYKGAGLSGAELGSMVWPQPGHRMIAGNPNNTGAVNSTYGRFDCHGTGLTYPFDHIPTTAEATALGAGNCTEIIAILQFPMCWDGVSITGTLGVGHMAEGGFYTGCTDPAYPVLFPTVSYNIHFRVANLADLDHLRLSSDQPKASAAGVCNSAAYNYCAGASWHGDWVNGWSTAAILGSGKSITTIILEECIRGAASAAADGFDCHNHLLGNPAAANAWYTIE